MASPPAATAGNPGRGAAEAVLLVLCSCPPEAAGALAKKLVTDSLAACINILADARSIYLWQGEVHDEQEALLLIKTTQTAYAALEKALQQLHPYELPEIICISLENGLEGYLQWVNSSVTLGK